MLSLLRGRVEYSLLLGKYFSVLVRQESVKIRIIFQFCEIRYIFLMSFALILLRGCPRRTAYIQEVRGLRSSVLSLILSVLSAQ